MQTFRILLAAACLLLIGGAVRAQTNDAAAWAIDVFEQYRIEPNVVYAKRGDQNLKLDMYLPKNKKLPPQPTLIFIHGGGWTGGTKENYALRVLPWMEMGWTVVNVEYRLADVALAPAAVKDCRCALRWVYNNAEKYNLDKKRIVVSGQSAGGHLALMTGMLSAADGLDDQCPDGAEPKVAAVINWFGITDVSDLLAGKNKKSYAVNWLGEQTDREAIARKVSPINHIRAGLPPIFTVHGDADPTVPYEQAVKFHAALAKAGVSNELITIPNGKHGTFNRAESLRIYEAVRNFLKKNNINK